VNGFKNPSVKLEKKMIKNCFFIIAFLIALIHLKYGIKALFVFTNYEPFSLFLTLVLGPLSTLPALVIGLFWKRIGALWLILGSVISFVLIIPSLVPKGIYGIFYYFLMFSGPMLLIGLFLLYLRKRN
jgi:hypothetical protein